MRNVLNRKGLVVGIMLLFAGSFFVPSISGDTNNVSKPVVITVNQSGDIIEITYEINDFIKTNL